MEGRALFEDVQPPDTEYEDQAHLAFITSLLGPPPTSLLTRGRRTLMFYDAEGMSA